MAVVLQLQADMDHLLQEHLNARRGPSTTTVHIFNNPSTPEHIFYFPKERRYPLFRGACGINVDEWVEEVQASMRAIGIWDFIFDQFLLARRFIFKKSTKGGILTRMFACFILFYVENCCECP